MSQGAGISNDSLEEGQLVVASGRRAIMTLSFDVDRTGVPVGFKVEQASEPLWGKEAIAVVRQWRFQPSIQDGKPVIASGQVDLAWGSRELPRREDVAISREVTGFLTAHPPIVSQIEPVYSQEALARNIAGRVLVSMIVDEHGTPHDLKVQMSPGYGLDQKAVEAISQWRFRPIVSRGQAKAVPATVSVIFEMPHNVVKPKVKH
jgi:TonB family protein